MTGTEKPQGNRGPQWNILLPSQISSARYGEGVPLPSPQDSKLQPTAGDAALISAQPNSPHGQVP